MIQPLVPATAPRVRALGTPLAIATALTAAALPARAELIGQWTFEGGSLADSTGNFGDLILEGDAGIAGGALDVNGLGTGATGWAHTPPEGGGVAVAEKTLVAWITLEALSDVARAGSVLTLDSVLTDKFDGIVFAERDANRWMSGSNGFSRTPPEQFFEPEAVESNTGEQVMLAITYEDILGTARITGYRDGAVIGSYDMGPFAAWDAGEQEVIFGKRHLFSATDGPGAIDALIHEARLYDTALSQTEIQALEPATGDDTDQDGLEDAWELGFVDNLTDLDGTKSGPGPGAGTGDFDGDGLSDIDEQTRLTDPTLTDTDEDGLDDGAEVTGAGDRPPTSPNRADTDRDGLTDAAETNTGVFVDANDTGTNPTITDTDEDGFSDGDEVLTLQTNPLDPSDPAFEDALLGHWTFEAGVETTDLTGNFPDLILEGDATVMDGSLDVNGFGTDATGWAHTDPSGGGVGVASKTLVSWLTLESLSDSTLAGSAMTLDSINVDKFDGIVFAERSVDRWMNGSSGFARTPELQFEIDDVAVETTTGEPIMIAISYQDLGLGQVRISGYRNGVLMGSYDSGNFATWTADEQEVIFGKRHLFSPTDGPGALDALIEEARLYGRAATEEQILALFASGPSGAERLAITDFSYDRDAGIFEITWVSKPGSTYRLEYLPPDVGVWLESTDSYPPGGATENRTTYRFEGIPPTTRVRFFRAVEE